MKTNEREPQIAVNELMGMLCMRRKAGGRQERRFIRDWIAPLKMEQDNIGNLWKRIGDSNVLWSCHTDTVHRDGGTQKLAWDGAKLIVASSSKSNCLGADDTAGCWLMRELILAEVPGVYVFHRAEEIGGLGSSWIAKNTPHKLEGIRFAIALDRRGKTDVITHQAGGRCCSDVFANSLADGLNMDYKPCEYGVFTDTANYIDDIGECTNLSVGYNFEHTSAEELDVAHIWTLRHALVNLDQSALTSKRKPGEYEPRSFYYGDYVWEQVDNVWRRRLKDSLDSVNAILDSVGPSHNHNGNYVRPEYVQQTKNRWSARDRELLRTDQWPDREILPEDCYDHDGNPLSTIDMMFPRGKYTIEDFVRAYPKEVADVLEGLGYNVDSLARETDMV